MVENKTKRINKTEVSECIPLIVIISYIMAVIIKGTQPWYWRLCRWIFSNPVGIAIRLWLREHEKANKV